jgi:NADH:ubiquinone oxidoreductase subunit
MSRLTSGDWMAMALMRQIFTWWHGAGFGTRLFTRFNGVRVGGDAQGNVYYRQAAGPKRWVIYAGEPEASRVPPEWHGWLHHTVDHPPTERPPLVKAWEKPHEPNLTGTPAAYFPPGSLNAGGVRARATGDYEAWVPEQ